jgi:hypothetical protein
MRGEEAERAARVSSSGACRELETQTTVRVVRPVLTIQGGGAVLRDPQRVGADEEE